MKFRRCFPHFADRVRFSTLFWKTLVVDNVVRPALQPSAKAHKKERRRKVSPGRNAYQAIVPFLLEPARGHLGGTPLLSFIHPLTNLEERSNFPAVGEQVGRPAGVRSNPHLCVRLIDVHLERSVARGLEASNHALVTGLPPGIFLAAGKREYQVVVAGEEAHELFSAGLLSTVGEEQLLPLC